MTPNDIITWLRDKLPYAPDHGWKNKMQEAITMPDRLEKKLEFAEAERDVVTKRMVELEQAAATPVSKAITNADCIRAMSDEHLAKVFTDAVADGCPPQMDWDCAKDKNGWDACDACWCKWLQQPAEEAAEDEN